MNGDLRCNKIAQWILVKYHSFAPAAQLELSVKVPYYRKKTMHAGIRGNFMHLFYTILQHCYFETPLFSAKVHIICLFVRVSCYFVIQYWF